MGPKIDFENFCGPNENVLERCQDFDNPPLVFWRWLCYQASKRRMVPAKGLALSLGLSAATVQDQARHGMFSSEIRTVVFPGKGGTRMTFVDERQVRAYNSMSYKEKLAHGRRMRVG